MNRQLTRQDLHNLIWETTMKRLAPELGLTPSQLSSLCRRYEIATPGPGYWTLRDMGRLMPKPPLGPPTRSAEEVIEIEPPVARRRTQAMDEPAIDEVSPSPVPAEVPVETATEPEEPSAEPPRPSGPTKLSRQEMYDQVWETPMVQLAARYGVSGNGLAKICDRADVPYPSRGYWAKRAADRAPARPLLPDAGSKTALMVTIRPTPVRPVPELMSPEVQDQFARFCGQCAVVVPEHLHKPHRIIAAWRSERECERKQARDSRSRWGSSYIRPDFTPSERRKHRIFDALFKTLEKHGAKIGEGDRKELYAEVLGEKISFGAKEKYKHVHRPLTDDEKRSSWMAGKETQRVLEPSGFLLFEINQRLGRGLRTQWLETDAEPLEASIPEIAATFLTAAPFLVEETKRRVEAERLRRLEEQRHYELQQQRKLDHNRLRRFTEFAVRWRDLEVSRQFLDALRQQGVDSEALVGGLPLADWLAWAEDKIANADPLAWGAGAIFESVAATHQWTYHD